MIGILKSFVITFRHIFQKKVTVQYPEQTLQHADRYRGVHILEKELCIGCKLCVVNCPDTTNVITLETMSDPAIARKIPSVFKIDLNICCFCGICTEVCPTNCLQMTTEAETADLHKENLVIDLLNPKDTLLSKKHATSIHQGWQRESVKKERNIA